MPYPRSLRCVIRKDHSSSVGALASLPSASATWHMEWAIAGSGSPSRSTTSRITLALLTGRATRDGKRSSTDLGVLVGPRERSTQGNQAVPLGRDGSSEVLLASRATHPRKAAQHFSRLETHYHSTDDAVSEAARRGYLACGDELLGRGS